MAQRREFGHREGDLILFRQALGQQNLTSLVERTTRFTVLLKHDSKRSVPVMAKIATLLRDHRVHEEAGAVVFDQQRGVADLGDVHRNLRALSKRGRRRRPRSPQRQGQSFRRCGA